MTGHRTENVFHCIRWEVTDHIGLLTLDRPPSNDMTEPFFGEINQLVSSLRNDREVRGIIIRGAGRHFSSGAALDELLQRISGGDCPSEGPQQEEHFLVRNYRSFQWFEEAHVPVIAAIRGVCLGSAFELALLSHFRICSEDAVFGLPETSFNLLPGLGGIRKILELSGKANTIELVLRGKTFSASEALELGLVDRIVPKRELHAEAFALVSVLSPGYRKEKRPVYINRYFPTYVDLNEKTV